MSPGKDDLDDVEPTSASGATGSEPGDETAEDDARVAAESDAASTSADAAQEEAPEPVAEAADETPAEAEAAEPEDAPAAKPRRRRRKAAEPAAEAEAEAPAEEAEAETETEPEPAEAAAEVAAPARRERQAGPTPSRRRARRDPDAPVPVVRAQAKYVRSSARKARLVCDHIRGKSVDEARAILALTPRAIAQDWSKLLESAVANAEHNHELVGEDLYVKAVHADEGPTIKRFRPRAMGRATRIRKRTSHLTILLTPKD
jgi:ribosomal protein L22